MNALSAIQGQEALWLLAANTLLHELGVPIPVMPTALLIGAHGLRDATDVLMLTVAMVGASLTGNIAWFVAGRRYGAAALNLLCRFSLTSEDYALRARRAFEHWGSLALVVGRFVPGVLLVAPTLAGAMGMSVGRFIALTAAGATLYAMALFGTGFLMRDQVSAVLLALQLLDWPLITTAVAMLAACIVWRWWRHVGRRNEPTASGRSGGPKAV